MSAAASTRHINRRKVDQEIIDVVLAKTARGKARGDRISAVLKIFKPYCEEFGAPLSGAVTTKDQLISQWIGMQNKIPDDEAFELLDELQRWNEKEEPPSSDDDVPPATPDMRGVPRVPAPKPAIVRPPREEPEPTPPAPAAEETPHKSSWLHRIGSSVTRAASVLRGANPDRVLNQDTPRPPVRARRQDPKPSDNDSALSDLVLQMQEEMRQQRNDLAVMQEQYATVRQESKTLRSENARLSEALAAVGTADDDLYADAVRQPRPTAITSVLTAKSLAFLAHSSVLFLHHRQIVALLSHLLLHLQHEVGQGGVIVAWLSEALAAVGTADDDLYADAVRQPFTQNKADAELLRTTFLEVTSHCNLILKEISEVVDGSLELLGLKVDLVNHEVTLGTALQAKAETFLEEELTDVRSFLRAMGLFSFADYAIGSFPLCMVRAAMDQVRELARDQKWTGRLENSQAVAEVKELLREAKTQRLQRSTRENDDRPPESVGWSDASNEALAIVWQRGLDDEEEWWPREDTNSIFAAEAAAALITALEPVDVLAVDNRPVVDSLRKGSSKNPTVDRMIATFARAGFDMPKVAWVPTHCQRADNMTRAHLREAGQHVGLCVPRCWQQPRWRGRKERGGGSLRT